MPLSHNFYGTIEGRSISADFSQLNWHAQKTDSVKRIMNKIWDKTKFNPWYNARRLIKLIADTQELSQEQYILTNSSAEAIYLIAQAYRNAQSTIVIPTRNEYEAACKANKHHLNFILKNKLTENVSLPGGLAFISHPNNLDGSTLEEEVLRKILAANTNTIFVIDQTYIKYVPGGNPLNGLLKEYDNLLIVESISQSYGFSGLPVGYIAGNAEFIERIWEFKPPHSYNAIAIETARYVLTHRQDFEIPIQSFLEEKRVLQEKLAEIPHLEILESKAAFFMIRLLKGKARELTKFLWQNYSVIVREVSSHRGIDTENIRLIAKGSNENFLLLKALKDFLSRQ